MSDDDGSVLPLVAVWLMALAVMAMALAAGADMVVDRARAQAAADAGALAGAAEGREAADRVVRSNGGVLIEYREAPGDSPGSLLVVDVVARVDDTSARAAAERHVDP